MRFQRKKTMKPFRCEKERLQAALAVVRSLHENPEHAVKFETGTTFTPVGIDEGNAVLVVVNPPEGKAADTLQRVACTA
jgi:hypothetical protein